MYSFRNKVEYPVSNIAAVGVEVIIYVQLIVDKYSAIK